MEPLESGQIQPLGLSHAIGPPGWRPYFQTGIPSILKRLKHPKPDHQSLWWTFPLAPPCPPPPCPPLAQGPTAGRFQKTNAPNWRLFPAPARTGRHLPPPKKAAARGPGPGGARGVRGVRGSQKVPGQVQRPRQRWELRAPALNPKR